MTPAMKKYKKTDAYKQVQKRYNRTTKGKLGRALRNKKYEKSMKGKIGRALRNKKYLYGLTIEEITKRLDSQNYSCAICQTSFPDKFKFYVDHDHETGKVRGFLCNSCNGGLGLFKDNSINLLKAILYLQDGKQ